MRRVYIDSCVYISFLTNEFNNFGKLKGIWAGIVFEKFFNKEIFIVISTRVIKEIISVAERKNFKEEAKEFIDKIVKEENSLLVRYYEEDKIEARKLNKTHFSDALHIVLAIRYNCDFLTTENISDFIMYDNLIKIIHPRELE